MDKELKSKQYKDCNIRPLEKKDLIFLPDLYKEYYTGNTGIETNRDLMNYNFKKLKKDPHINFVVIEKDSKIIGFCQIVLNEVILDNCKPFITLWTLRVDSRYRKKGYGKLLLKYVEEYAREKEASFIAMISDEENKVANNLYETTNYNKHIGWVKTSPFE